jgi:hypothetical protein
MNLSEKLLVGMFGYGFLRGARADYPPPHDIIGHRLGLSFFNGVYYMFPPYGLLRVTDILNRADVYISGKNPDDYKSIYSEVFGLGKNKNIFF